ncbi:hypothetical protein E6W36_12855 [Hankyongella ginsenosidimutans]|uniref:Uncharacterized protein n=1 Tax=Hankyongella ginsenosidimutans TaxID=1763828 RepID=A0A4D7C904_9SPHN|nr:hypothetical protein [Hankyongella ginsenosidimutans]QCI80078.1 hypothetical protein E6W36_12855 [Hankyongella ginsenosidimutans]TXG83163.1 MAG: hypothetical protein E6R12_09320 [Sphingomonadales bacterium]
MAKVPSPSGRVAVTAALLGAISVLPLMVLAVLPQEGGRWLVFGAPGRKVALIDRMVGGVWLVDAPEGLAPADVYAAGAWLVLDAGALAGCGSRTISPSTKGSADVDIPT